MNAREPRTWETEVNDRLAADVRKYPNAHLIDWHDYGGPHDELVRQRRHPPHRRRRAQGYADLIRQHLELGY